MSELDGKMFLFRVPDMPEEIVKGTDAWHIIRGESTDDRIERTFFESGYPISNGSDLEFNRKQVRTQHGNWISWSKSEFRIRTQKDVCSLGKIQMPELYDDLPCLSGYRKRIWIIK